MGRKRRRAWSESPESRRHRRRQRRDGAPAPSPLLDNDKAHSFQRAATPDQQIVPPPASGRKNPQQLRRSPRKLAGSASLSLTRDRRDASSSEEDEEVDELDDEVDELAQEDEVDAEMLVIEDSEPERQAAESHSEPGSTEGQQAEPNSSRSTRGVKANYLDRGSDSAASTSSDETVTEFSESSHEEEGSNRSSSPSSVSTLRDDSASSIACSTASESDYAFDESHSPRRGRRRHLQANATCDSDEDSSASSSIVVASCTPRRSPRRKPKSASPSLSARRTPRSTLLSTPRRDRFFEELSPFMHEAFVRPNDPEMRAVDRAYRKQAQSDPDYAPNSDSDSAGRSRRGNANRGRPSRRSLVLLPGAVLDSSSEGDDESDDGDDGEEWLGCDPEAGGQDLLAAEVSDRALDTDTDDDWDDWDLQDDDFASPQRSTDEDAPVNQDKGDASPAINPTDESDRQDEGYASEARDKRFSPADRELRNPIPRRGARPSQNIPDRYEHLGYTIEGKPAPHPAVRFHGLGAVSPVYDPSPPRTPPTEEEVKEMEAVQKEMDEWADAYKKAMEEFSARMLQDVPPGWGQPPVAVSAAAELAAAHADEEEVDQLADSDELEYAEPPTRRRSKR